MSTEDAMRVCAEINELRLTAFRTNAAADRDAYHNRLSEAFQRGELWPTGFEPGVGIPNLERRADSLIELFDNQDWDPDEPAADNGSSCGDIWMQDARDVLFEAFSRPSPQKEGGE